MDWFVNCIKNFLYLCVGLAIAGVIIIGGLAVTDTYFSQEESEPIKLHTPAPGALVM